MTRKVATASIDATRWIAAALMAFGLTLAIAFQAHARSAPESFADLAEELLPSVVNISTTQTVEGRSGNTMPDFQVPPGSPFEDFFKEFFDRNQQNQPKQKRKATSLGSGFIIQANGNNEYYVVTNNHVIEGADEITAILQDDTRLSAELVGRDAKTDLAVLKVQSKIKLPTVGFGNSDKTRVGDWVVAIGNPFGLGGTVTAGIVSARGRDINSGPYDNFIQTDASINRGNSGGPMFNVDGKVIGINTAIYSPSGGSVGIGFAIPSNIAESVIVQLIKHGQVRRGWLGVHIQTVTEEFAEGLGLKEAKGALVASVLDGSPAQKGGIEHGDVILKFGGREIDQMRKLPRVVAETEVGKTVKVKVWRDGKKKTLKITIAEMSADEQKVASTTKAPSSEKKVKRLGLVLSPLDDKAREKFGVGDGAKGVVVVGVAADGPSAAKQVRPGDIIVEVNQREVATPEQVEEQVASALASGRKSVLLLVEGQAGLRFVAVKIAKN